MTDDRYKELMTSIGMPENTSLLNMLKQVANGVAQEATSENDKKLSELKSGIIELQAVEQLCYHNKNWPSSGHNPNTLLESKINIIDVLA